MITSKWALFAALSDCACVVRNFKDCNGAVHTGYIQNIQRECGDSTSFNVTILTPGKAGKPETFCMKTTS